MTLRTFPTIVPSGDLVRCWTTGDPLYDAYHDLEWGHAVRDENDLYERISLEAFQSGLSWITVLRKRENFRAAFAGFDPEIVAEFTDDDVERLLQDVGIIRNRLKIEATIANARALRELHAAGGTLQAVFESHAPEPRSTPPTPDEVPSWTPESKALSKELKKLGFKFVGPTTAYAAMQACGFVDDHVSTCWINTVGADA